MKWIKGFLIFGMVMLAHSTISINDVDAKAKTEKAAKGAKKGKKAKAAKASKNKPKQKGAKADKSSKKVAEAKPKKKSLFSSFTSGLKGLGSKIAAGAKVAGSKIAAGAKAAKDKAAAAAACRSGKGEEPGKKLYAMASSGTALTDAHIVAAHTTAAPKAGRKK